MKRHIQRLRASRSMGPVVALQALTTVMAAVALFAFAQARSLGQFLTGPAELGDGEACMLASTLIDSSGNAYVLDDPGWGGSGTQVDLWQVNDGSNQFWTFNNVGGNSSDYYAIQAYWNQGLCLDCSNSGTAPGTPVQVWTCNGTGAQNWAVQTFGANQPVVIVPENAYWMALSAPGAFNGALLTLESQDNNPDDLWSIVVGTDVSTTAGYCADTSAGNVLTCTMTILSAGYFGTSSLVLGSGYLLNRFGWLKTTGQSANAAVAKVAANVDLSASVSTDAIVEGVSGVGINFVVDEQDRLVLDGPVAWVYWTVPTPKITQPFFHTTEISWNEYSLALNAIRVDGVTGDQALIAAAVQYVKNSTDIGLSVVDGFFRGD